MVTERTCFRLRVRISNLCRRLVDQEDPSVQRLASIFRSEDGPSISDDSIEVTVAVEYSLLQRFVDVRYALDALKNCQQESCREE